MAEIRKTDERLIDANGIQIAYDTFGNPADPPILLVMGLGMQMIAWDELFCEHLAMRGYWVVRFDNRDIGLSTKMDAADPPGIWQLMAAGLFHRPLSVPYRLKDMAADTACFIEALGLGAAHIVGVSMGGMIAQEMAIRYPDRLLTMTSIMSTTGDPRLPQARLKMRLRLLKRSPSEQKAYEDHRVSLFKLLNGSCYPYDAERYRQQAAASFKRSYYPKGVVRHLAAVISSGSRKEKLGSVDTPSLIIHGDEDPLVPVEHGHATAEAIPNARRHIIRGMAHTLPQAAWPEIIDAIARHATSTHQTA